MNKKNSNPCTRCGKERINSKTWQETVTSFIGTTSVVTYIQTVCPDSKCQKIVEKELAVQKRKKEEIEKNRSDRKNKNKKFLRKHQ